MVWKKTVGKAAAMISGLSRLFGRAMFMRVARDGFGGVVSYAGNIAMVEKKVAEIRGRRQAIAVQT